MKTSFIRQALVVFSLCCILGSPAPLFGAEQDLNQAFDLVHQAWNPSGEALDMSNDKRTDLLTQAMKILQASPNHHLKKHRVNAIAAIKSALEELKKGDPDNKAAEFIHTADSELRDAMEIAD
jgi:hypothetical protein